MYLYLSVHWKAPKSYYFKTIRSLLIVHKHEKTNYESLLDNSAPIFTIFNANVELKQESRAIIREKTTLCMQKRTIKKWSKPILCYSSSYTTHRLILSRDIETNPGLANCDNQQTKPKSDHFPLSARELCNKTVRINSKRLMRIHW